MHDVTIKLAALLGTDYAGKKRPNVSNVGVYWKRTALCINISHSATELITLRICFQVKWVEITLLFHGLVDCRDTPEMNNLSKSNRSGIRKWLPLYAKPIILLFHNIVDRCDTQ